MRNHVLAAGIAAAVLIPSFAMAQQVCAPQNNNRVAGTAIGAGIGALAGSAVAGRDDRTAGAVIGGLAGALIGNQVARGSASATVGIDCSRAYGYYDSNNMWHATDVARSDAQGYYDRNGAWVAGAPNGYYDGQGRWISANSNVGASGYWDSNNRWVPASAAGYYASNGTWVASSASGYYSNGRWIAGPANGRYDVNGRWIPGQASGRRDANGVWIAEAQTGYYDTDGRWRPGQVMGYYDAQGRWIATAPYAGANGANVSYETGWRYESSGNVRTDVASLDRRIRLDMSQGRLNRQAGNRALRELNAIRREEARLPHRNGQLNRRDEVRLEARLDVLSSNLRFSASTAARNNY